LRVTVRRAKGEVTRVVPLPRDVEASAVILAGNLARDEAEDLVAGLRAKGHGAPTPAQASALAALKQQAGAYERGAEEYREAITSIVKVQYEAKKRQITAGLDREIAIEKAELAKARAVAIARLEAFVAAHQGPEAADAMYRLAALYEERARE